MCPPIRYIAACLILISVIRAQEKDNIEDLRREYESFNYGEVVQVAERLLRDTSDFSRPEIAEIYLLKAIAHYSLDEEDRVRASFIEILKIDDEYYIDPARISPKIIKIFDQVKSDYHLAIRENEPPVPETAGDTVVVYRQPDTLFVYESGPRDAIIRSLILPGWGHLYSGNRTKGFIITGLSTAALASMIYFIIDANQKEKAYLNETDLNLIEDKYSDFNTSYKARNVLVLTYALIWIYTQLDLLLFENHDRSGSKLSYRLTSPDFREIRLSLKINL